MTQLPAVPGVKSGARLGGMVVQARDLTARLSDTNGGVEQVSFHIPAGEVTALTGTHREDRSALCAALAGQLVPTKGQVLLDGVSLYAHLKAFQPYLGYVPDENGLHPKLSVAEILQYEARLRMPRGTTRQARQERIERVRDLMALRDLGEIRFGQLGAAQKRRVRIGVALLTNPGVLIVEESEAPLNPPEEIELMDLLRGAAQEGTTVLLATLVSGAIAAADLVIVLASGGALAWFGPPDEAVDYFQEAAPEAREKGVGFHFDPAAAALASGSGESWRERFRSRPEFQRYVDDPLNDRHPDILLQDRPLVQLRGMAAEKQPPARVPPASGVTVLGALIGRGTRALTRERSGLLLLVVPLLVGLIDFFLSSPRMFDPLQGDPVQAPAALGVLVFLSLLTPALLFQAETFRERAIYRPGRKSSNPAGRYGEAYVLSKAWLVGLLALYQAVIWTLIHAAATGMAGGVPAVLGTGITLFLTGVIGGLLGCIAAMFGRTAQSSVWIVLLLTLPQFLLNGGMIPLDHLPPPARYPASILPTRYAFESVLTLSGYGRDIATDPCWQLPEERRNALSDPEKQSCTCLGDNIYSTCNFPGIHKFFTIAIEQPKPVLPTPGGAQSSLPVQPELNTGETLEQYAQEVNNYTLQLEQYQSASDEYTNSLRQSADDLANWQRTRSLAIGNAEGVITQAYDHYGDLFQANPVRDWLILSGMSILLMIVFAVLQK